MSNASHTVRKLAVLAAGLLSAFLAPGAPVIWSGGGGANMNWSASANWTGGTPGPANDIKFYDPGASATVSNINNIVDATTSVLSLQYGNTNLFHTTLINPGVTLTALGALTAGTGTDNGGSQTSTSTITGPGGTLVVNNSSANFVVSQGSASSGSKAILDMSGLDTFIATVSAVQVGLGGPNRPSGQLFLARTNTIKATGSTPAISTGCTGSNNGGGGSTPTIISLGQSNAIFAGSLAIARQKQTACTMNFNSAFNSPVAYFRAADGVNRIATWTIGDGESNGGTTSCNGTCDFTGGTVDAQVNTMTVGRASSNTSSAGTSTGTLTFNGGTLDVNTLQVGLQTALTGKAGVGTVNVNGTAKLVVNTSLQLGQASGSGSGGNGAANTKGTLNITGGTVQAYAITTTNISGDSAINLSSSATLVLSTTAGSPLNAINNFSSSDSTLTISFPDTGTTNLFVNNLTMGGAGNTLTVGFLPGITSYPVSFPLISYTNNLSGTVNFTASLPAGYTGTVVDDSANHLVWLRIDSGPIPKNITWRGTPTGTWNTSDQDWLSLGSPVTYAQGDFVTLDDSASGTTTVNLPATVMPGSLAINNSTKAYTFTGTGKLSGFFDLLKQGAGALTLDNAGVNDFVGDITISAGTLQVGNADANGSLPGGALYNGGALVVNRTADLTAANLMSGGGALTKNGSAILTLSGANSSYTGAVSIAQGTLKLGHLYALGATNAGTTIASGGTLDVNGFGPTNLQVTVSGAGVGGNGAIVNNGASVFPALSHVTMTADTTFGGSGAGGRWDIRYSGSGATDPALASLSSGGHAYNLTKVGSNYVGICNATIDPALANIDIQGGTLSFQYNDTGLGNSSSTLTVRAGATLELYNLTNQVNKAIVLNGSGTNTTLNNGAGANTVVGAVTLNNGVILSAGGTSLALNGAMGGTGSLTKYGGSYLYLNGANTYSGSTTVTNGTIAINGNNAGGGLLTNTPNSAIVGSGTHTGPVMVSGTVNPGDVGVAGTLTTGPLTLVAGATPVFDLSATPTVGGGVNDLLQVNGNLNVNNTVITLNLLQGTLAAGTYRLINYTGALNGALAPNVALSIGGSSRYSLALVTSTPGQVNLLVGGGPANLKWNSTADSTWDVGTTANWLNLGTSSPTPFYQADTVLLDDSVSGVQPSLNLVSAVAPSTLTVNSGANNYSITGAGKITSAASLLKQGSSTLLLGTTNDFLGTVTVQAGILQVTNNAALGATNGGTTIQSGATLDVCGPAANESLNLGLEAVTVSGSGVGGQGAIINSSATISQHNALRNVILAGDTTFGGTGVSTPASQPGRWDIRSPSTGDPSQSSLSTGGHAYNLTKVGPNQISMVGTTVDPALADIDVQQGLLGFETATTSMGNPARSLTVRAGGILSFYNTTSLWNKNLVLYGDGTSTNIYNWSGSNTFIGPVTLNGDCVLAIRGTALTFTGVIGGSGGLLKIQPNSLYLYGANTYSGDTQVKAGTLFLGPAGTLGSGSPVLVSSGATLDASGRSDGTLNLAAGQLLAGAGTLRGSVSGASGAGLNPGDAVGAVLAITSNLALNTSSNIFQVANALGNNLVVVSNNLSLTGLNKLYVDIAGVVNAGQTFTLIQYGGSLSGSYTIQVSASPGYSCSLLSTPGALQIQVDVVPATTYWVGNISGNWDTSAYNWTQDFGTPTNYLNFQTANFGDYPAPVRTVITLVGTLTPSQAIFQNYANSYSLLGSGKLSGGGSVTLQGGGAVLLDNSGTNDYSGATTINSGQLQIGNNDTHGNLGMGAVLNNGALTFQRTDNLSVPNAISGWGVLTNLGSGRLTLSGSNSMAAEIYIANGTVRVDHNYALGGNQTGGTTIQPGATLDVGAPSLAAQALHLPNEAITVSGSGLGGQGAIINSSTNSQQNALSLVTLVGDTTLGGPGDWSTAARPGRWDIRNSSANADVVNPIYGELSTGYQPFNLTKVGSNWLGLVGLWVDPTLADIYVKQGLLSIEHASTMGDPAKSVIVTNGAVLEFWQNWPSNVLNKAMVLYGDGTSNANLINGSGNNVFVGPITLNSNCQMNISGLLILSNSTISGSGGLIKSGAGTLLIGDTVSYPGNTVVSDGRLSFITGANLPSSPLFDLSTNTSILDVSGTGGTLTLGSGQSLHGKGTLWGSLTANAGSTVAPGESIGTLRVTNGVTLGGSCLMELDRSNPAKCDNLSAASISLGGTLTVANIGPRLQTSDTFVLFSGALSSSISPVSLPPLWPGLSWNTASLNSAGQISVAGVALPPQVSSAGPVGANFVLSGSGGLAGATYYVLASSNLTSWVPVATNAFLAGGSFSCFIPINPIVPKQFYRLQVP